MWRDVSFSCPLVRLWNFSRLVRRRRGGSQQRVRTLLQRLRELAQVLRGLPEVVQYVVDIFAVRIQRAVQLIGHIVGGFKDAAKIGDGFAKVGAIFSNRALKSVNRLSGVGIGFLKV